MFAGQGGRQTSLGQYYSSSFAGAIFSSMSHYSDIFICFLIVGDLIIYFEICFALQNLLPFFVQKSCFFVFLYLEEASSGHFCFKRYLIETERHTEQKKKLV